MLLQEGFRSSVHPIALFGHHVGVYIALSALVANLVIVLAGSALVHLFARRGAPYRLLEPLPVRKREASV